MWKLNDILLSTYGIIPGQVDNEGIAVKGIFDLPKRLGKTYKDWDDADSFEPYVAADEIFLEGRTIIFQGILTGTKAETEANIEFLKSDISNFIDIAPFETPYGSYCVYVTKITSKIYNGIATVFIEMREPEVGASCGVSGTVSTYYSAVYSETTRKNNCAVGYYGLEVSLSSTLEQFTSTFSQAAADRLAIDWVRENKQLNANNAASGTYCAINPPIFYSEEITDSLQKNDCATGYAGSTVRYTIPADAYTSDGKIDPSPSQAKANAKAQAAMDLVLTQSYANANGTCSMLPTMTLVLNATGSGDGKKRLQIYLFGEPIIAGTIYFLMVYSYTISYTSIAGDTTSTIAQALATAINNTTEAQWNSHSSAPRSGTPGFKPYAVSDTLTTLTIYLNYQNIFFGRVS